MSNTSAPKKRRKKLHKTGGLSANMMITIGVIVLAVALIGGAVWYSQTRDNDTTVSSDTLTGTEDDPAGHEVVTSEDDKVTVVEFLDYQCPACNQYYHGVTKELEKDYEGKITFVTRNYPLENIHPLAQLAAQAAEAAALQGKYVEMYNALYGNYDQWAANGQKASADTGRAQKQFDAYAEDIGLNLDQFHRDMKSDDVKQRIERDVKDGDKANVEGTPTIFVNGKKFSPNARSLDGIKKELYSTIDKGLES